jgi:IS1 family transposase
MLNDSINFINDAIEVLELKKQVFIKFKFKSSNDSEGEYLPSYTNGKLKTHKITIYCRDNTRTIQSLVLHELIHAKQEEMGISEIHGKVFKKWALILSHKFNIDGVYLPEFDLP